MYFIDFFSGFLIVFLVQVFGYAHLLTFAFFVHTHSQAILWLCPRCQNISGIFKISFFLKRLLKLLMTRNKIETTNGATGMWKLIINIRNEHFPRGEEEIEKKRGKETMNEKRRSNQERWKKQKLHHHFEWIEITQLIFSPSESAPFGRRMRSVIHS